MLALAAAAACPGIDYPSRCCCRDWAKMFGVPRAFGWLSNWPITLAIETADFWPFELALLSLATEGILDVTWFGCSADLGAASLFVRKLPWPLACVAFLIEFCPEFAPIRCDFWRSLNGY